MAQIFGAIGVAIAMLGMVVIALLALSPIIIVFVAIVWGLISYAFGG